MELIIRSDAHSGGEQCDFEHNGKNYWAGSDDFGISIYEKDENGNVNYDTDVYWDGNLDRSLEECINEFINEQQ